MSVISEDVETSTEMGSMADQPGDFGHEKSFSIDQTDNVVTTTPAQWSNRSGSDITGRSAGVCRGKRGHR